MRRVAALAIAMSIGAFGCRGERAASGPADPSQVSSALLQSPAEAPDLDPAPGVVRIALTAERTPAEPGAAVPFRYTYSGQSPGPTLRAKVGQRLEVELTNALPDPTTIHWHGLHVPFEMDGVPFEIPPVGAGETKVYAFDLTQAGTFWYHPHFDTARQVDLGLYGALVVTDPAEPATDEELVLVVDSGDEHTDAGGHADCVAVRERERVWTVNGQVRPTFVPLAGTSWRVRVVNASNCAYLDLRWPGMRRIGGDQGLLAAPETLSGHVLSPGDRADFEWLVGADPFEVQAAPYSRNGGPAYGDPQAILFVEPDGAAEAPAPIAWPVSTEEPTPDPGHTDIVYTLSGSNETGVWVINGQRFHPMAADELPLGATAILEVRNLSPTHHPFHLHGHSFEVLSLGGVVPERRQIEDTIDIPIHAAARLRFVADNPGAWMAHCHILPHADEGMMTVLRVVSPGEEAP
jgi:FtsP/CotA-like multicopper oxidase with cupredoxin domain